LVFKQFNKKTFILYLQSFVTLDLY